jgi:predicted O-methyltransferase YrrM
MVAQSTIELIPRDEYFADYDAKVAAHLDSFAALLHAADADPLDDKAARELAALGSDIAALALRVCGRPDNAVANGSFDQFASQIRYFIDIFGNSGQDFFVSAARDLGTHADYCASHLAALADQPDRVVDDPGPHVLHPSAVERDRRAAALYCRDFVVNAVVLLTNYVFNSFKWIGQDPRAATQFFDPNPALREMPSASAATIDASKSELEGWCSTQKATLLYSLVREHKPNAIVEIGIYGGRSIVPMAVALRDNGRGFVTGVETWSAVGARQYRTNIGNDFWWMTVDFKRLKRNFYAFLAAHDLDAIVKVVEAPSDRAYFVFDQIDMLHIDGGHSTFGSAQDVINYASKVRRGGIIIYDDIDWPSTAAGLQILMDTCQLLHVVEVADNSGRPGCAAFMKV